MSRLLTIAEAAEQLGVPKGSLETAARTHGFLVSMGRARRIDRETLPELIRKCREKQQEQDSTAGPKAGSTSFETRGGSNNQRALQTAERLKQLSRGTSPSETGQRTAQLHRIK